MSYVFCPMVSCVLPVSLSARLLADCGCRGCLCFMCWSTGYPSFCGILRRRSVSANPRRHTDANLRGFPFACRTGGWPLLVLAGMPFCAGHHNVLVITLSIRSPINAASVIPQGLGPMGRPTQRVRPFGPGPYRLTLLQMILKPINAAM